ncbi:MAG: hypothetical protein QF824_04450 [Candidatus Woesearchaeota archaeon]|jgi:hypothetical protein|nr:hypothetical protein [Candidatus Woesearchaeota archaeon]
MIAGTLMRAYERAKESIGRAVGAAESDRLYPLRDERSRSICVPTYDVSFFQARGGEGLRAFYAETLKGKAGVKLPSFGDYVQLMSGYDGGVNGNGRTMRQVFGNRLMADNLVVNPENGSSGYTTVFYGRAGLSGSIGWDMSDDVGEILDAGVEEGTYLETGHGAVWKAEGHDAWVVESCKAIPPECDDSEHLGLIAMAGGVEGAEQVVRTARDHLGQEEIYFPVAGHVRGSNGNIDGKVGFVSVGISSGSFGVWADSNSSSQRRMAGLFTPYRIRKNHL